MGTRQILRFVLAAAIGIATGSAAAEQTIADLLKEGVDQGMTIDQVVQAMAQDSPEKVEEIVQAALDLTKVLPYGSCDQCNCGGGDINRQYPVQDLEPVERQDWVKEVETRYFNGQWEAMPRLRRADDRNPASYFFHFTAGRDALQPYLQPSDQPSQSEIERYRKLLETKGFTEPLKVRFIQIKHDAYIREGRALMEAAGQLGINEFPVLFGFTECIVCGGHSESDHYTIPRLRENPDLRFAAPRFFQDGEYLLADRQYPKSKDPRYGFDYHAEMKVEELLEYFSGEPNQAIKEQWKKEIQEKGIGGALGKAMEIAMHFTDGHKKGLDEVRTRMKGQHEALLRRVGEQGVTELLAEYKGVEPNPAAKTFWLNHLRHPGTLTAAQQSGTAGSLAKEVLALLAAARELGIDRIDAATLNALNPIAANYLEPDTRTLWLRELNGTGVKFGADSHELLAAAHELGMQTLPVNLSFLDEVTCQAGIARTVFSASELLEDDRMKTVADRFFEYGRRLILDEDGRRREERLHYPFGPKIFNYHMMTKVEDLLQYMNPEKKPDEALIKEMERELVEKGVVRPIYISLLQDKKESNFLEQSEAMIIAAQRLGMVDRLPVRVIYLKHPRQNQKFCEAMIRKAANLPKRVLPPQRPPQSASPS